MVGMDLVAPNIRAWTSPGGARAALIVAAWTLVALAWTPPTLLTQQEQIAPLRVFVFVLLGFIRWMIATPALFWLGGLFPIDGRSVGRNILIHMAAGVVALPAITAAGTLLWVSAIPFLGYPTQALTAALIVRGAFITTLYAVPNYVAVVAIGQAIVYFKNYRTRERLLARAQLQALQAQIKPHFLFNTLNAISTIGYRDPALADRAITRLSELLRMSLVERPQEISLRDEVAFARGYLDVHTLLLGDRLRLVFEIAPDTWNAAVPTMLLQPLVENAIIHGVAKRVGGGAISLTSGVAKQNLILAMRNDPPDGDATISNGAGMGLANVRERLAMLYGPASSVTFGHDADGSAIVTVALPYRAIKVAS